MLLPTNDEARVVYDLREKNTVLDLQINEMKTNKASNEQMIAVLEQFATWEEVSDTI